MGAVNIVHNVRGGTAADTGRVVTEGKLTSVTIGGSLIGGTATRADFNQRLLEAHNTERAAIGDA